MRTVIAVPVKDEAERIGTCLAALLGQREVQADAIVLVVNNTRDATAAIARSVAGDAPVEVIEVEFPPERASAGSARRMAMERAAELAGLGGALLTTDADGRVPPDWVAANLFHLRRGADAVAGRAILEPGDAAAIPERLHADDALECAYAAALDEIAAVMMPQAWDPWPRHTEHSGASIAVTLAAYRLVGGMPAAPISEDRRFFAALQAAGARIRHAPEIEVAVSGRIVGRAEGGMADTIRRRLRRADPYLDDALEPALDFWRRQQGKLSVKRRLVSAESAAAELEVARWILTELRVEAGLAKVATP
ncbi:MAG: glycosyltransferase [Janthinobacterium lividum]